MWTITEVFEYDIMMSYIIQRMPCKACNRISILRSVFVWTGKNDSNTLRVDTMDKKISFFKNIQTRVDEAWKWEKTTARKSLQFGYSGKKRMDGSLKKNVWIALRD